MNDMMLSMIFNWIPPIVLIGIAIIMLGLIVVLVRVVLSFRHLSRLKGISESLKNIEALLRENKSEPTKPRTP